MKVDSGLSFKKMMCTMLLVDLFFKIEMCTMLLVDDEGGWWITFAWLNPPPCETLTGCNVAANNLNLWSKNITFFQKGKEKKMKVSNLV